MGKVVVVVMSEARRWCGGDGCNAGGVGGESRGDGGCMKAEWGWW